MDILTSNPEVWKKTIFILCYDENDGYFDHIPPFVPPHPSKKDTGKVSAGIDTAVEYVALQQDLKRTKEKYARESPIGLGYRVPLVIASPWSRGGAVCSQVFDHTSILQLMEKFLQHKTGRQIVETNISQWRRTVCGDLTAVFRPFNGEKIKLPTPVIREKFYQDIHKAQFKKDPVGYETISDAEAKKINNGIASRLMPRQEKGIRIACPLPYELYADGALSRDRHSFEIKFKAGKNIFDDIAAGAPFNVYAWLPGDLQIRNYAVTAGDQLKDEWQLSSFDKGRYSFQVNGPNGFSREFRGDAHDPALHIEFIYENEKRDAKKLSGNVVLVLTSASKENLAIVIRDNPYNRGTIEKKLGPIGSGKEKIAIRLNLDKSFGWYDFTLSIKGAPLFEQRYTGHVETGKPGRTDPAMGNL